MSFPPPTAGPYSFPKEEHTVLQFWREIDAFQTSLKQSEGKPTFTFFDGPPFATGKPHYGHLLAGTVKVRPSPIIFTSGKEKRGANSPGGGGPPSCFLLLLQSLS
jgi:hypothetical protein